MAVRGQGRGQGQGQGGGGGNAMNIAPAAGAGDLFIQRITDAAADANAYALANFRAVDKDVLRDTGMTLEKNQWNQRLLALTSPFEYDARRQAALAEVEQAVQATYQTTYNQYIRAGVEEKKAADKALANAKETKNTQMAALRLQFNEKDEQIYTQQTVKHADAFVR